MMQAVKDLREMYGEELDSDENVTTKQPRKADDYNDDSDSDGVLKLQKDSHAFREKKTDAEEREKLQSIGERFKASVPGAKQPKSDNVKRDGQPLFSNKYDPRDYLDDAGRKRVKDLIAASRERNNE